MWDTGSLVFRECSCRIAQRPADNVQLSCGFVRSFPSLIFFTHTFSCSKLKFWG
jgi:hypothetical protein